MAASYKSLKDGLAGSGREAYTLTCPYVGYSRQEKHGWTNKDGMCLTPGQVRGWWHVQLSKWAGNCC